MSRLFLHSRKVAHGDAVAVEQGRALHLEIGFGAVGADAPYGVDRLRSFGDDFVARFGNPGHGLAGHGGILPAERVLGSLSPWGSDWGFRPGFAGGVRCSLRSGVSTQAHGDLDVGKDRAQLQGSSHRLNVLAQGADMHVCALFDLRDGALGDTEIAGDIDLGQFAIAAQILERHLRFVLGHAGFDPPPACGRKLVVEFSEFTGHDLPYLSLPVRLVLLFDLTKVPGVDCIGLRNEDFIPAFVACFVASDEQDCHAARVEGVQDTVRAAFVLDAKLAHIRIGRTFDGIGLRPLEVDALFFENANGKGDAVLFFGGESLPPFAELFGIFDLVCHAVNITQVEYSVKYIFTLLAWVVRPSSRGGVVVAQRGALVGEAGVQQAEVDLAGTVAAQLAAQRAGDDEIVFGPGFDAGGDRPRTPLAADDEDHAGAANRFALEVPHVRRHGRILGEAGVQGLRLVVDEWRGTRGWGLGRAA